MRYPKRRWLDTWVERQAVKRRRAAAFLHAVKLSQLIIQLQVQLQQIRLAGAQRSADDTMMIIDGLPKTVSDETVTALKKALASLPADDEEVH